MKKLGRSSICKLLSIVLAAASVMYGCQQASATALEDQLTSPDNQASSSDSQASSPDIKVSTRYTKEANDSVYETLDFSDEQEREFAERGLIARPDSLVIKSEDGTVVWSQESYDFVRDAKAPDTANPSLWRNTELNALYGLFEVVDGVYQVRGYDVANLTFVRGKNGWIVFDCTTCVETAKAGLELLEQEFGDAHISAVVISHAHTDHYGGIGGLVSQEDLADPNMSLEEQEASGKTLIIVPDGFEKAAMEENVFAGNAMKRRTNFQYGTLLEKGEKGSLSVGIGLTPSNGTGSYLAPTYVVQDEILKTTIDGVELEFQLTPNTESPAEMNTYLPGYKTLWMAENCTGTMHNLYTLRGAEVRDGNAWAQYIMEAKELFGKDAEVIMQSHNWPHWGNNVINEYMTNTAAVYKYIFAQTLMYINQGYTSTEITDMIELPDDLNKIWYTRQYYGTLKHNVKAVYQKYMGWYDANPIHLDELQPTEYSKKLVEYLGDTDKVLEMAQKDYENGQYQWVAQITNTLVYADPNNEKARNLCADALEQLGYQAESGAWRNAYLTGAYELRNGTDNYPDTSVGGTGAILLGMSTETMLDYLGICLDEKQLENENLIINLEVTDENEKYLLRLNHGVLLYSKEDWSDTPDAVIKTKKAGIVGISRNNQQLMDACIESSDGKVDIIKLLTDHLADFPPYFNIIEP